MRRIQMHPALVPQSRPYGALTLALLVAAVALLGARAADAAATPEQQCQKGRYAAAAKYAQCELKVTGKLFAGGDFEKFNAAVSKCRVKYTATWAKLQAKATGFGGTCDNPRFVDNADGTVTDRLTALQWEQKTDDSTPHDKDNEYVWSSTPPYTAADGNAFTTFLTALNSGGCLAGQCDWRLPTRAELQTILLEPYSCTTIPCIGPVFGLTVANNHWSGTTDATYPDLAWIVDFDSGTVDDFGDKSQGTSVRAVRGGL